MSGRPRTPLIRLEDAAINWRRMRRELMGPASTTPPELVRWIDALMRDVGVLADSGRMVATIFNGTEGIYSEAAEERWEEIRARRDLLRTA